VVPSAMGACEGAVRPHGSSDPMSPGVGNSTEELARRQGSKPAGSAASWAYWRRRARGQEDEVGGGSGWGGVGRLRRRRSDGRALHQIPASGPPMAGADGQDHGISSVTIRRRGERVERYRERERGGGD
jgi:hypothetical protein